jgi:hypothetical protein
MSIDLSGVARAAAELSQAIRDPKKPEHRRRAAQLRWAGNIAPPAGETESGHLDKVAGDLSPVVVVEAYGLALFDLLHPSGRVPSGYPAELEGTEHLPRQTRVKLREVLQVLRAKWWWGQVLESPGSVLDRLDEIAEMAPAAPRDLSTPLRPFGVTLNENAHTACRGRCLVDFKGSAITWRLFGLLLARSPDFYPSEQLGKDGWGSDPGATTRSRGVTELRGVIRPLGLGVQNKRLVGYRLIEAAAPERRAEGGNR